MRSTKHIPLPCMTLAHGRFLPTFRAAAETRSSEQKAGFSEKTRVLPPVVIQPFATQEPKRNNLHIWLSDGLPIQPFFRDGLAIRPTKLVNLFCYSLSALRIEHRAVQALVAINHASHGVVFRGNRLAGLAPKTSLVRISGQFDNSGSQ